MSEISKAPTSQYLPPLDYPKPLAKLIATRAASHAAWRDAYTEVVLADARLTQAPALDKAALEDAVAAGKGHPGQVNETAARAALAVAEEKCRVARERATTQTDIVKGALDAATDQLVPVVLANIRATAAAYDLELAACAARIIHAQSTLQDALSAVRMVAPHLATHYGITVNWHESRVPGVTWPVQPTTAVHHRLEHLETMIAAAANQVSA